MNGNRTRDRSHCTYQLLFLLKYYELFKKYQLIYLQLKKLLKQASNCTTIYILMLTAFVKELNLQILETIVLL